MKRNLNKNVMSKIAGITKDKVELQAEKLELGLAQDFNKATDAAIDAVGMGTNKAKKAKEPLESAINQLKNSLSAIKRAEALGEKLDKAVKDLGVEEPRGFLASKSRLEDESKRAKDIIDKLEKISSQLRF